MPLTKLEEMKLRVYRQTFPSVTNAEQALSLAIRFEEMAQTAAQPDVFYGDAQRALSLAALLEKMQQN